jgi:hypothetical protein
VEKEAKLFGFNTSISARGFLRGTALLIATSLVYLGLGSLYKHHDVFTASMAFLSVSGLMVLFGVCHGFTPNEVSELRARTSGRGIMRWLALITCIGAAVNAQYAAWWLGDFNLALRASLITLESMFALTVCYIVYTISFTSERTSSKSCWSLNGTARDALVKLSAISAINFLLVGLSSGTGSELLASTACAAGATVLFAVLHAILIMVLNIDDDRG